MSFNHDEQNRKSKFRMYNPNDLRENKLASHFNRELNEIQSAPSVIFLLEDQKIDDLYGEIQNPVYSEPYEGVIGWYQMSPTDFQLDKWGLDAAGIDLLVIFNKEEIDEKLPRSLQPGDLILDVDNRLFEVMYIRNDQSFKFRYISEYVLAKRVIGDHPILQGRRDDTPNEKGVNDENV